jgi:hypothetical protein
MLDASTLAGVAPTRALLTQIVAAAWRFIPDHSFDRVGTQQPPYDEPYILPENLFRTYQLTREKRFLDLAQLYLLDEFFEPLAEGRNEPPGRHGYSHVMALSSAAKAYELLGNPEIPASDPQCMADAGADAAVCVRSVGTEGDVRQAGHGRTVGQPHGDARSFRDAMLLLRLRQVGALPDGGLLAIHIVFHDTEPEMGLV